MGGLELLLLVAALWGIPFGLLWILWRRYSGIQGATGVNRLLAAAAFDLALLSSGAWLLLYGLVLISEYYKAINSILSSLQNVAAIAVSNILICAVSFILSLFVPKTIQGAHQFQRAVSFTTGYMLLVWVFALTSLH